MLDLAGHQLVEIKFYWHIGKTIIVVAVVVAGGDVVVVVVCVYSVYFHPITDKVKKAQNTHWLAFSILMLINYYQTPLHIRVTIP